VETGNKTKPGLILTDESAQKDSTLSYYLYSRIAADGMSFSIFDPERKKHLALFDYPFEEALEWEKLPEILDKIIAQNDWLKKFYKSSFITIANNKSSLVPTPLFEPGKAPDYLKLNAEINDSSVLFTDNFKSIDAKNVYSVPNELTKRLKKYFPSGKIMHSGTVLIDVVLNNYKHVAKKQVFINVSPFFFDVLVHEGSQLIFFNTFQHHTKEDLNYFLLFVYEQLKLNPEEIPLIITGNIQKTSHEYELLQKYIRNISFAKRTDTFEYSYKFDEIPFHSHYELLNMYISC
jgi:hypothetical protein